MAAVASDVGVCTLLPTCRAKNSRAVSIEGDSRLVASYSLLVSSTTASARVGSNVTVYYDPADPANAALER